MSEKAKLKPVDMADCHKTSLWTWIKDFFIIFNHSVKENKIGMKDKVNSNLKVIYGDPVLLNYIWMLTSLCWAIAMTLMGFGVFIASMIYSVRLLPFLYVGLVMLVYWLTRRYFGKWIDRAKWREWLLEGTMVFGILFALFNTSFGQLFNIGTFILSLWAYKQWKSYFKYRYFYKMAKKVENEEKNRS